MKKIELKVGILQGELSYIASIERSVHLVSFLSGEFEHSNSSAPISTGKKESPHLSTVILFYSSVFATYLKSPCHWGVEEMKLAYASEETLKYSKPIW
ncbi:hypothetical protein MJG53_017473 [Ovis ammon polii x Ovis aries]|uniref:Uncharacterized protein n=1 Tax=Ovis ammon polii x Ovis aries TaxID=2918886 RepID=A0ACB9U7V5_9CETA|nr:hypothetical protein MJG53_017473 [Ovis ammon polii x Ovis aries]